MSLIARGRGSLLMLYVGRCEETRPAIVLQANSGVRGLTFLYPEQKCNAIVPYSPMIQGRGAGIYVVNTTAINPYHMIDCASYRCDRTLYPIGAGRRHQPGHHDRRRLGRR